MICKINLLMLFVCSLMSVQLCLGQSSNNKPSLELKDLKYWPELTGGKDINAMGTYVFYSVKDEVPGLQTMHVRSVKGNWEKKINSVNSAEFSAEGHLLIGMVGDTLFLMHLGSDKIETIPAISGYNLLLINGTEYLIYHLNTERAIVIYNLESGNKKRYTNVTRYAVCPNEKFVSLFNESGNEKKSESFHLVNIASQKETKVWEGEDLGDIIYDQSMSKLAFTIENKSDEGKSLLSVWLYEIESNKLDEVLNNSIAQLGDQYILTGIIQFLGGGDCLEFKFKENIPFVADTPKASATANIYSYTDKVPYSLQEETGDFKLVNEFKGIYNFKNRSIIYKQKSNEDYRIPTNFTDRIGFVEKRAHVSRRSDKDQFFIINTVSGKETEVKKMRALLNHAVSPDENYMLLTDEGYKIGEDIYSCEINTGIVRNLTTDLPIPHLDQWFPNKHQQRRFILLAWIEGTTHVLINDSYDIWRIDVSGKTNPVNITNGFGRKNRMVFNIGNNNYSGYYNRELISKEDQNKDWILSSYDYNTGNNDYYNIRMDKVADPKRLTNGGWMYESVEINTEIHRGGPWSKKAAKANIYLVIRQNSSASLNLFVTSDFKSFKPVSNIYPEKKFNWLTSEFISFNSVDGRPLKGVLYKPEDFNTGKKYPVIFYFYSALSQDVYLYKMPALSHAVIDIPYYVSNGYIVCTPDMGHRFGNGIAGQDALNSVVGAANFLSAYPWIDSTKMAIHGHSWGGCQINYIVTQTNKFAAAMSGSGQADAIGGYGMPTHGGRPNFGIGYDGVEGTIHDHIDVYIKNTPKLHANKMNTPLLIMHNKDDVAVLFQHSLSFFYTLRELGKRVWLLQYDGENHTIEKEANKIDFTIRMKQFFDHYLKDAPAPKWMTQGLPYKLKGIDDGLEYDKKIKTPVINLSPVK